MKNYYQYANHIISIDFPEKLPLINLKQHLPHILHVLPKKADISIEFIESSDSHIIFDLETLRIFDIFNSNWLVDFPHLIYSYLKYVFFHKDIYFVHSCLIQGTLFIGHSGTGKTSLCIEAINRGMKIASTDRTCVRFENNQLHVLSGTDILSVRQDETQPHLSLLSSSGDRNIYECELDFQQSIQTIKLFQINDSIKNKNIEGLAIVHQLFPFFMDNIKTDCFVQSGKLLFCPVYAEINKKRLFHSLEHLNIPVAFVSGNYEDILN